MVNKVVSLDETFKSEIVKEFFLLRSDTIRNNNHGLFGELATFIESLGGDKQTVKARKDMISKLVWSRAATQGELLDQEFDYLDEWMSWFKRNHNITPKESGDNQRSKAVKLQEVKEL